MDSCLYLVREHDPTALSRSFDELQLFEEQASDVLSVCNDGLTLLYHKRSVIVPGECGTVYE